MRLDWSIITDACKAIKKALGIGNKAEARSIVADLGNKVPFPRLDAILDEYDDADRGGKFLWGQWGPADDLVATGTMGVDSTFLDAAGHIVVSEGLQSGREDAAQIEGVKGVMWSAAMEETTCPACEALDGQEWPYPSDVWDAIGPPPAHCNCSCIAVYTADEETNFNPVGISMEQLQSTEWSALISKYGHDMPIFKAGKDHAANEATVTGNTLKSLWDSQERDMRDELKRMEDEDDTTN